MMHNRKWVITDATSATDVVEALSTYQNECYGIRLEGFLFLNDSSVAGIREFAVVDECQEAQVDSWTTDWMSKREIEGALRECLSQRGELPVFPSQFDYAPDMIVMAQ